MLCKVYCCYKLEAIDMESGVICGIANVRLLQEQDVHFMLSRGLCDNFTFSSAHTFHIELVDVE